MDSAVDWVITGFLWGSGQVRTPSLFLLLKTFLLRLLLSFFHTNAQIVQFLPTPRLSPSLTLCFSLSLSLKVYYSLFLLISLSHCLRLSLSLSLSLSLFLSPCIYLYYPFPDVSIFPSSLLHFTLAGLFLDITRPHSSRTSHYFP